MKKDSGSEVKRHHRRRCVWTDHWWARPL